MLDKTYRPEEIERKHYEAWENDGEFKIGGARANADPYTIVIPPPNVTGSLHMGHALNNTLQDILIRYRRMQGRDALWQPGTDHAGIATQMVVERQMAKKARPVTIWAGKNSSNGFGSGKPNPAAPSPVSCVAWARLATGRASASPWTTACLTRSPKFS